MFWDGGAGAYRATANIQANEAWADAREANNLAVEWRDYATTLQDALLKVKHGRRRAVVGQLAYRRQMVEYAKRLGMSDFEIEDMESKLINDARAEVARLDKEDPLTV